MREIKFRGKTGTTEGKKWVYGYLYKIKSFFSEDYQYFIKNEHLQETSVDEETIGQYTGLKDKNGKEIYEGDIVKIKNENVEIICEIIYLDTAFRTKKFIYGSYYDCLYYWYANDFEIEVIGNIYDNPELLEKGE